MILTVTFLTNTQMSRDTELVASLGTAFDQLIKHLNHEANRSAEHDRGRPRVH